MTLPCPLQSEPGEERASGRLSALSSCVETSLCWITGAMLKGEKEYNLESRVFKQYPLNLLKCTKYLQLIESRMCYQMGVEYCRSIRFINSSFLVQYILKNDFSCVE